MPGVRTPPDRFEDRWYPPLGLPSLRKRRRIVLLAVVLAAGLLLTWKVGWWSGAPASSESQSRGRLATPGLTLYPVANRRQIPAIHGPTLGGGQLALSSLRGHVIVLNIWASWCAPCRAESPALARLSGETYRQGVRFVGIDTRDQPEAGLAFRRSFHIRYPSLVDRRGELLLPLTQLIPVNAIPSTVVIDPGGQITARVIGPVDYATLRGLIADVWTRAWPATQPTTGLVR
jgi:thiol-disulfide isomerase/thioredoxin